MRPHPLLSVEQGLRLDVAAGLKQLRLAPDGRGWNQHINAEGRLAKRGYG
jgi:hypothetical protein